jgi:rhodanese-related sulfurtransferase
MKYTLSIFLTGIVCLVSSGAEIAPDAEVRFGSAVLKTPLRYHFSVPNSGGQAAEIAAVRVSCDCLSIMAYAETIEPGSEGALDALFVPDRTGEVEYSVTVEFDKTSGRAPYVIRFSGLVNERGKQSVNARDVYPLIKHAVIGKVVAPDTSCYCDMEDMDEGESVFVDIRSPDAFRAGHIADSLNIPPYALGTKDFLKDRNIVLVDEGYGLPETEQLCRTLRETGFHSVSILRGGWRRWVENGGKDGGLQVAGDRYMIGADIFRALQRISTTMVIYAGLPDERADCLLYGAVQLSPDDPAFSEKAAARLAERKAQQIILVTKDGENEAVLRAALLGVADDIYGLEDGLEGYVQSLELCEAMSNRSTVTVKYSASPDGSRSSIRNSGPVKKGCGCGK